MRAREFLSEYNRQVTAQRYVNKILQRMARDRNVSAELIASFTPEQRQLMAAAILEKLEAADPTPNKQYMPWIAAMYSGGGYGSDIEDLASTTRDALAKFHELKSRRRLPPFTQADIMQYRTVSHFLDVVDSMPDPKELDEPKDRGQAQEVYSDADVRVIVPQDQTAACYYGRGTRWCTSARDQNYFDHYHRQGDLYILLPQQARYPGEKYQLHWESGQFMNERDEDVDPSWLLTQRFPGLLQYFRDNVGDVNRWMLFAQDDLIRILTAQIRTAAMQAAWEAMSDMEANDDYYYDMLRREGYTDESGDIDWERVEADGMTWMEYNPDAEEFMQDLEEVLTADPKQIKERTVEEYGVDAEVPYINDVLAKMIRDEFRRKDIGIAIYVADFVDTDLDVRDLTKGQGQMPQYQAQQLVRDGQGGLKRVPLS